MTVRYKFNNVFFETICKKSHYERNNRNNVKSMLCYNHHIHILNVDRKYFHHNFHTTVAIFSICLFPL